MIFVKIDPVVMHATSITPASWVLLVLASEAVAMAHVAPKFLGLPQSGWQPRWKSRHILLVKANYKAYPSSRRRRKQTPSLDVRNGMYVEEGKKLMLTVFGNYLPETSSSYPYKIIEDWAAPVWLGWWNM